METIPRINRLAEPISAVSLILLSFVAMTLPLFYVLSVFMKEIEVITGGDIELQIALIEDRFEELFDVSIDLFVGPILIGVFVAILETFRPDFELVPTG